jgi:hypothetical protein
MPYTFPIGPGKWLASRQPTGAIIGEGFASAPPFMPFSYLIDADAGLAVISLREEAARDTTGGNVPGYEPLAGVRDVDDRELTPVVQPSFRVKRARPPCPPRRQLSNVLHGGRAHVTTTLPDGDIWFTLLSSLILELDRDIVPLHSFRAEEMFWTLRKSIGFPSTH